MPCAGSWQRNAISSSPKFKSTRNAPARLTKVCGLDLNLQKHLLLNLSKLVSAEALLLKTRKEFEKERRAMQMEIEAQKRHFEETLLQRQYPKPSNYGSESQNSWSYPSRPALLDPKRSHSSVPYWARSYDELQHEDRRRNNVQRSHTQPSLDSEDPFGLHQSFHSNDHITSTFTVLTTDTAPGSTIVVSLGHVQGTVLRDARPSSNNPREDAYRRMQREKDRNTAVSSVVSCVARIALSDFRISQQNDHGGSSTRRQHHSRTQIP